MWKRHESWGPAADEALERAPGIIGAGDDPSGFRPGDAVIRGLARRFPGVRITRSRAVFEIMIRTVVAQKVTGQEAKSSYHGLATSLGEPAPGPGGLLLPPDPQALAGMAYFRFHPFGIERKRAGTLIAIARSAGRLEEAADLPLQKAKARLQAIPGVGAWTAAKVALTALGDPDAVPVGDYNLPNAVAWMLAGEPRADDDRMLELLEPYAGHRGRVIRLIQASGEKAPRFGPRRPTRRFNQS